MPHRRSPMPSLSILGLDQPRRPTDARLLLEPSEHRDPRSLPGPARQVAARRYFMLSVYFILISSTSNTSMP
jgi:hypothetical protein